MPSTMEPGIILVFSGKRKSGKDYITDKLQEILGNRCAVLKISRPVKKYWAEESNLDLNALMSDSDYKEKFRKDMVKWSDKMRTEDYGCFCRKECEDTAIKPIWIVSDARRKSDLKWFSEMYGDKVKTIRIVADTKTRESRGFVFTEGIDDDITECNLDDYNKWDLLINNGSDSEPLELQIKYILKLVEHL